MTENQPIYYVNNKKCVNVNEFITEIKKLYEKVQQKNEQLKKENNQLKEKVDNLNDARLSYKQDWKYVCASLEVSEDRVERLEVENEELKQQLADIDKLIYDLGHNEMQRQYEEITKESGEHD